MRILCIILYFTSFVFAEHNMKKCGMIVENQERDGFRWSRIELSDSIQSTDNYFMIHFDRSGVDAVSSSDYDGDGIPNYVEEVEAAAMHSKNLLIYMGYELAIEDNNAIYDIYINNMSEGYYGVNVPDGSVSGASFILIDNQYESSNYGPITGLDAMRVTVAHEFFHAIQRAYGTSGPDHYIMELSSTWFEDVAYPEINDYVNWADPYLNNPEAVLSEYGTSENDLDPGYALALFGHYLTKVYDDVENEQDGIIMRSIWNKIANSSPENGYVREAIDEVLSVRHNISFADAWSDFNARNLFNGEFSNEYNHIYYYEDQKYFDPIDTDVYSQIEYSTWVNPLNLNNISNDGVKIRSSAIDDQSIVTITIEDTYDYDDFSVYYAIVSSNPLNHRIYHMNEFSSFNIILDEDDRFHMLYTAYVSNDIDLDMQVEYDESFSFLPGDVNLDGTRTELDNAILIEYINEIMSISKYQTDLLDINNTNSLNVSDVIKLVNIILEED